MTPNSVNSQKTLNPVLAEVLDILGLKNNPFDGLDGDYRSQIDAILKGNAKARENKKLALYLIEEVDVKYFYKLPKFHNDMQVILAALRQDSGVFSHISVKLRAKPEIAQEAIKSLVREQTNFIEVEKFLSKYFSETKMFRDMFQFYKKYLQTAEYFFRSDVEKQLIMIKEKYPQIYTLIFQKKLLDQQGKNIVVGDQFTQFFLEQNTLLADNLSPEDTKLAQIALLQNYLGVPDAEMSEELQVFFSSVLDLIHIKKQKQESNQQEDDELGERQEKDIREYDDEEQELSERFDFCIPQCGYVSTSDGGYDLSVGNNITMHLSKEDLDTMTDSALKNYIAGVTRLTELGLGIAIKFGNQFFSSICGIDPFSGEGLSDGKMLKILNKVGKVLGIPERHFTQQQDKDGNKKKEIGCFNRLEEAVYQFRQIAASGKINNEHICDVAQKGNRSIVEIALIQKGYFDAEGKGFNIGKWI